MHLADLLVMLEGTYILVGTWGIPLHTWHALPSETASVTHWPEGYCRPGEQGSQLLSLASPGTEAHVHCERELTGFVTHSPHPQIARTLLPSSPLCHSAQPLHQLFCHCLKYSFKCVVKLKSKKTAEGKQYVQCRELKLYSLLHPAVNLCYYGYHVYQFK